VTTVFERIFETFGSSRLGQIVASVVVMAAFSLLIWLLGGKSPGHLWSFLLYGCAMGLVAGLVLTVLKRGKAARDG
jgi:hypothetical protein